MSLPVAILAGGLATRLGPVAARVPKSLVDVAGRPFAAWQIDLLRSHGFDNVVFLVGHLGDQIRQALGDGDRFGVRLRYVADGDRPRGTGGALHAALPHLGDRFLVLYGDSYLDCDWTAVERAFVASGRPGLMTVCRNDGRWDASNVRFDAGRILAYDKQRPTPEMRHIDYGLGAFTADAFAGQPDGVAFDLASLQQDLLARGALAAVEVPGRFYEIGSPAGLDETRTYLSAKGLVSR